MKQTGKWQDSSRSCCTGSLNLVLKQKDCGEPLCPACEKPSGRNKAENQLVGNQVLALGSTLVQYFLTFGTINTFLEAWGRTESTTYKISWKLRCLKYENGFSNLQMSKKTVNTGKRWEIEVKGHNQEQRALRSHTSEKPPGHQTSRMCHMCLQKGNGRCVPFYSTFYSALFSL